VLLAETVSLGGLSHSVGVYVISKNVWMSSNYLSFLGVVAHFVSKSTSINSWGALIRSSIATPI
jgi:hypothetical protein